MPGAWCVEAIGDLAPHRLGETGRRELRHILRTVEMSLVALALPTRRPFDTTDQLDERMRRADAAFAMAYELGTKIVLARAGAVPPPEDEERLEVFSNTLLELGRRAEHRGVKLALETGAEPGEKLKSFLDALGSPGLAASIDPGSILQAGIDPIATVRELASWVVHAYAKDATGSAGVPALQPARFWLPSRRPRLGRVSGLARGDRLPRLPDGLASAGPPDFGPVLGRPGSPQESVMSPFPAAGQRVWLRSAAASRHKA